MAQIKLAEYTFDNSVGDVMPSLTPNTITMTKEDSVSGTTTRRIVYIDNATMPTRLHFENKANLLAVEYIDDTNISNYTKTGNAFTFKLKKRLICYMSCFLFIFALR